MKSSKRLILVIAMTFIIAFGASGPLAFDLNELDRSGQKTSTTTDPLQNPLGIDDRTVVLSEQGMVTWQGLSSGMPAVAYGNRTDHHLNNQMIYSPGSGTTTGTSVYVPMSNDWEGHELVVEVYDLTENRTWTEDPEMENSPASWTLGTVPVGGGADPAANWLTDGHGAGDDCAEFAITSPGYEGDPGTGERAFARQNMTVDRGDVVWAGFRLDYWIDSDWGAYGFVAIYVSIETNDYTQRVWQKSFAEVDQIQTWYDSGLIEVSNLTLFDLSDGVQIEVGLYSQTDVNYSGDLEPESRVDNFELYLETLTDPSDVNLQMNGLAVNDYSVGPSTIPGLGNVTQNPDPTWTTGPVMVNFTWTPSPATPDPDREIQVDFNVETNLYARGRETTVYTQDPNAYGEVFTVQNATDVEYLTWFNADIPSGYDNRYFFNITLPASRDVYFVGSPLLTSENITGWYEGHGPTWFANISAFKSPDRWGYWLIKSTGPNMISDVLMVDTSDGGSSRYLDLRAGDSTKLVTQLDPRFAGVDVNLTIYSPSGAIWYTTLATVNSTGYAETPSLTFGQNATAGSYMLEAYCDNSVGGTAWNETGFFRRAFNVVHASNSELLNPADAQITWITNVTYPDLFLVRIRVNDSDIPGVTVPGGQMSCNWTTGPQTFGDAGNGEYIITLDSGDLPSNGIWVIEITWTHPHLDSIVDYLTINLNYDATFVLEDPESPGISVPKNYNSSFQVRFEDSTGNPIDYGIVDCNWTSYYTVNPITGSPGSYLVWLNTTFVDMGEYVVEVTGKANFVLPQRYLIYVTVRELNTRATYVQNVLEIPVGEARSFTVEWMDADHNLPLTGLNNSITTTWTGAYAVDEVSLGTYNITIYTLDSDAPGSYPVSVSLSGYLMRNQTFTISVIIRSHSTLFTLDEPLQQTQFNEQVMVLVSFQDTDLQVGITNITGNVRITITSPEIGNVQFALVGSSLGDGHYNISVPSSQWGSAGWKNLTISVTWIGAVLKYTGQSFDTQVRLTGTSTDIFLDQAPTAAYFLNEFSFTVVYYDVTNATNISNDTLNVMLTIDPLTAGHPVTQSDFIVTETGVGTGIYEFRLDSTPLDATGSFVFRIGFLWPKGVSPLYENQTMTVTLVVLQRPTYIDYIPVPSTPYGELADLEFSYIDFLTTARIGDSPQMSISLVNGSVGYSYSYDSGEVSFLLRVDTSTLAGIGSHVLVLNVTWVGSPYYTTTVTLAYSVTVIKRATQLTHNSFAPGQWGNNVTIQFTYTDLVAGSSAGMTGTLTLNASLGGWYTVVYAGNGHYLVTVNTSGVGTDGLYAIVASIDHTQATFASAIDTFGFSVLKRSTQFGYESPDPAPYLENVSFVVTYIDDSTGRGVSGASIIVDCSNSTFALALNTNYWVTYLGLGQYLIEVESTALGNLGTYVLSVSVSYSGAPYYLPANNDVTSRVVERTTQILIIQTPGDTPFLENVTFQFKFEDYITGMIIPIDKSHITLSHGVIETPITIGEYALYDFGTYYEISFNSTVLNPSALVVGEAIQLEIDITGVPPYYALRSTKTIATTTERSTQILFPLIEEVPYTDNFTIELDYIDFLTGQGIENAQIELTSGNWTGSPYQVVELGSGSYRVYINSTVFGGIGTVFFDILASRGGVPFYSSRLATGVPASVRAIITSLVAEAPPPGSTAVGVPINVTLTLMDFDHDIPLSGAVITTDWTSLYGTSYKLGEEGGGVYTLTLNMTGLIAQDYSFTVTAQKTLYQDSNIVVSVTPGASTFALVLHKTAIYALWGEVHDIRIDVRESYYYSLIPGANVTLLWNSTLYYFTDLANGTYSLMLDTSNENFGVYNPQISVTRQYYQTRQTSLTLVVSKAPGQILSEQTVFDVVVNTTRVFVIYLNDTITGSPVVASSITMEWNNTAYPLVSNGTPGFYIAGIDATGFALGPYEAVISAASLNHVFLDAIVDINIVPIPTNIGLVSGAAALFVVRGAMLSILVEYNDTYYGGHVTGANVTYVLGSLKGILTENINGTYNATIDTSSLPAQTIFLRIIGSRTGMATATRTLVVTIQPVPTEVTVDTLLREGYHNDVVEFTFYYNDTYNLQPIAGAFVDVGWEGGTADATDLGNGYYLVEVSLTPTSPRLYDIMASFSLQNYSLSSLTVRVLITATPAHIEGPTAYDVPVNHTGSVVFNVINDLTDENIEGLQGLAYWESGLIIELFQMDNGSYELRVPDYLIMTSYRIEIGFSTSIYSISSQFLDLTVRPVLTFIDTLGIDTTIVTHPGAQDSIVIFLRDLDHNMGISDANATVSYDPGQISFPEDRRTVMDGVYTFPYVVRTGGTINVTITFTKDLYFSQQITFTLKSDYSEEQILTQRLAVGGGFLFIFVAIAIVAYVKYFAIPWIIRQLNKMIAALAKGKVPSAPKVRAREALVLEIMNEELKPSGLAKELEDVPGPSIEAVVPEIEDLLERLAQITGLGDVELEAFRQDLARMRASERPGFIREVIEQEEARRAEALAEAEPVPAEAKEILEDKPEELEELRLKLKRKGMSDDEIEIIIDQAKSLSKADLEALLDSLGIKL